jgi:hypothetical protein
MTQEQWIKLYFSLSDEDPQDISSRFNVVICSNCEDPHCRGWKLEPKSYQESGNGQDLNLH